MRVAFQRATQQDSDCEGATSERKEVKFDRGGATGHTHFIKMAASSLKIRSGEITGVPGDQSWINRAGARAQMYAAGFKQDDFAKPIVTVAAPYLSYHMCNQKFRELSDVIAGE